MMALYRSAIYTLRKKLELLMRVQNCLEEIMFCILLVGLICSVLL